MPVIFSLSAVASLICVIMILAQAATQATVTAPWWAIPAGTIAGAIGGGVIALASTYTSDRRKQKYDDLRRWDNEILVNCSELLSESVGLVDDIKTARKIPSALERIRSDTPKSPKDAGRREALLKELEAHEKALSRITERISRMRTKRYELLLIAPQAVSDAASELLTATVSLNTELTEEDWSVHENTYIERYSLLATITKIALDKKGYRVRRQLKGKLVERVLKEQGRKKNAP